MCDGGHNKGEMVMGFICNQKRRNIKHQEDDYCRICGSSPAYCRGDYLLCDDCERIAMVCRFYEKHKLKSGDSK